MLSNFNFDIDSLIQNINDFVWGWPLIIFFVTVGVAACYYLNFVQFRYFFTAWKMLFAPSEKTTHGQMTPFQAFVNALNTSIGNGSLAGMAVAVNLGGPGAGFWLFIFGSLSLVIRYCEVYASNISTETVGGDGVLGGPMVYLQKVPGGTVLPYLYAIFCLLLGLVSGNAAQCNSIRLAVGRVTEVDKSIIALILFAFVIYVMMGGAKRIVSLSEKIVPVKVGVFFLTAIILLAYHYQSIFGALKLIIESAFGYKAAVGGAVGYTVLDAIRYGLANPLNATEAGLGTAGVLFGSTGSKKPVQDGIMSIVSAFISNYLVCFMLILLIVASGVWDSGLTSTELTIAAYQTVFGAFAAWVVSFLSIAFGIGVIVSYGFIGRECWAFLTKGRWLGIYAAIYCLVALLGTVSPVAILWKSINIVNAGLLAVNLYGIASLLPRIAKGLKAYENKI